MVTDSQLKEINASVLLMYPKAKYAAGFPLTDANAVIEFVGHREGFAWTMSKLPLRLQKLLPDILFSVFFEIKGFLFSGRSLRGLDLDRVNARSVDTDEALYLSALFLMHTKSALWNRDKTVIALGDTFLGFLDKVKGQLPVWMWKTRRGICYYYLGKGYKQKGVRGDAIRCFEKAVECLEDVLATTSKADEVAVRVHLGYAYDALGATYILTGKGEDDWSNAIRCFEGALNHVPRIEDHIERCLRFASIYELLGTAYRRKGDLTSYLHYRGKAMGEAKEVPTERALRQLATIYDFTGRDVKRFERLPDEAFVDAYIKELEAHIEDAQRDEVPPPLWVVEELDMFSALRGGRRDVTSILKVKALFQYMKLYHNHIRPKKRHSRRDWELLENMGYTLHFVEKRLDEISSSNVARKAAIDLFFGEQAPGDFEEEFGEVILDLWRDIIQFAKDMKGDARAERFLEIVERMQELTGSVYGSLGVIGRIQQYLSDLRRR